MYARKHEPGASEQMAAAIDRTIGSLERAVAAAQQRGEVVDGTPEHLTLVVGSALHGLAAFAANGTIPPDAAMEAVGDLVHHLLDGLRPR